MNEKEVEEVYRKIKEEETPDLWGRIEKELEAAPKKKKYKKWIISCSTVAAAVVIILLIVPLSPILEDKSKNTEEVGINEPGNGGENADAIPKEQVENENYGNISEFSDKDNKVTFDTENKEQVLAENKNEVSTGVKGKVSINGEKELTIKRGPDSNLDKIIAKLNKDGIVLKAVDLSEIEEIEEIKSKKISDEFQIVVKEFAKIEESPTYYIDSKNIYYVKIKNNEYRIMKSHSSSDED